MVVSQNSFKNADFVLMRNSSMENDQNFLTKIIAATFENNKGFTEVSA